MPYEATPFNCNSAQLVRKLMSENKLKPIVNRQARLYKFQLDTFIPDYLGNYPTSFLMTPRQMIDGSEDELSKLTIQNLSANFDKLTDENESLASYCMFLNYLADKNVNALSMSGYVREFVRQSCRGGTVTTSNGKPIIVNEPLTMIDMNSQYPYALSCIDIPIGMPKLITSKMSWQDVLSKKCFVVETKITKYLKQHELDVPLIGSKVLNNIDFNYRKFEFDQTIPPRGYYWDTVAEQPLKEFVESIYRYKKSPATRARAKGLLNKLTGMLIRKVKKSYEKPSPFRNDVKSHPLIKEYYDDECGRVYVWRKDVDYRYSYPMIQSLVYSKAKQLMSELFTMLHQNGVRLLYTSTDSLVIPTKDLHYVKDMLDDSELGKFKIEASGERGIFIDRGLYYISDDKFSCSTCSKEAFKSYCHKNSISISDAYYNLLTQCAELSFEYEGRHWSVGRSAIKRLCHSN